MAVNARPLSATEMMLATAMSAGASGLSNQSLTASANMAATPATAITRTGRIRDIHASDHRPATIRPSAPTTWVTVISVPAPAVLARSMVCKLIGPPPR